MRRTRIITIGRAGGLFREGADHYAKLIRRYAELDEVALKDAPGKLPPEKRRELEGEAILARLKPGDAAVCLDERGRHFTSREFAARIGRFFDDALTPTFIIGGPYGLSDAVRERCRDTLALGSMTLPHELARLVLLEQLYRALSILAGHPYHND